MTLRRIALSASALAFAGLAGEFGLLWVQNKFWVNGAIAAAFFFFAVAAILQLTLGPKGET